MYKLFALAAAISVIPISREKMMSRIDDVPGQSSFSIFKFKNTAKELLPGSEKPTTQAWSEGWLSAAEATIRKSEYHFTWEEKKQAWCTPNRKNNLRFFYNDNGFTVEPRATKMPLEKEDPLQPLHTIKYRNLPGWKIKFNLDQNQIKKGNWKTAANTAIYATENISVQYINNEEGMRQNFLVQSPLSKAGNLKINFNIQTRLKTYLHNNQLQFFHHKKRVLNYDRLNVWDAQGKKLKASIKKNKKDNYCIEVEDANAVYPVTIDPLSAAPNSILNDANQAVSGFGRSVSSAGDVNGDGYSDVIVGAYQYDEGANTSEGRAFVYHGSATGLAASPNSILDDANEAGAGFGQCVGSAGDVNGDGYSDVIIGAVGWSDAGVTEGGAFVYHGSAGGLSASPNSILNDGNQSGAYFGDSVAGAGDVNGDGYSDVIVGARYYDDGANTNEGRAFVYHGSATGLAASPASTPDDADQALAFFGSAVASAGDVNGDGYSDVIVGAYGYDDGANTLEGRAWVYHGSASGISSTAASTPDDANDNAAQFGIAVACAGDVNGDGYSDIVIGASILNDGAYNSEGNAFVYYGSATGISASPDDVLDDANQAGAYFGCSVACAGDVNGDGYSDVIVGAQMMDDGGNNQEGKSYVYLGSATGLSASPSYIQADANQVDARFGLSVASAGDVNGDGYSDIIVGAYLYDDGATTDEGGAFVYHGSAAGLSATPNSAPDDANQASASFGLSVASAGDVNADGYSDVIIGAHLYDDGANNNEGRAFVYHGSATGLSTTPNSTPDDAGQADAWFGYSVSTAGDVNGDGYSDVIIGAYKYDDGANADEGRAFVYHGSATGLSASANSTPDDANQAGADFGISVAAAGDVNSDGYSDVIIGAYAYNDGANGAEGRAFVYHGSAAGLAATPFSALDDANQQLAFFGGSVAGAGDVNGDGYSDVIVGAYQYDDGANTNEGNAFVYHGSSAGLSPTPYSVLNDANQADANFGISVSGAGDVNGDGYSDVIVGAYLYDDGANANEGRAYVYHGSAMGLSAAPNSTLDDANQAGAMFGRSVANAGDVNGDGYNDVVVGAMSYLDGANANEGRAFLYPGSATGLAAAPNNTPDDANQANAYFGISVAAAGDVNGDGYSDVLIGAYNYNDGVNADEGRAFLYNGNESTANERNNLRLYNSNLTTPINSANFNLANFGAGLFAKSFLGRNRAKLVWETRLNYNAYSGSPITNSVSLTGQQTAYTSLGTGGVELKNVISKINGSSKFTKLRARVKYAPSLALTGQVYGPWRYVSSIIDGNRMGALPLELVAFNVAWLQKGRTAQLNFTTDKESGICCFDIEKSNDGLNFTTIGSIPAKNSGGLQQYRFVDSHARDKNQYYRLKIKGIAGEVDYSHIQQLQNNTVTEIFVFPNPTADVLQVQLNNSFDKMQVQVVNSSGQSVKKLLLKPTGQTIKIPVQNLAAGKYWLLLESEGEKQVLQFVKE